MTVSFKQIKTDLAKAGFGVEQRDSKDQARDKVKKLLEGLGDEAFVEKMTSLPPHLKEWVEQELAYETPAAAEGSAPQEGTGEPVSTAAAVPEAQGGTTEEAGKKKGGKAKPAKEAKPTKQPKAPKEPKQPKPKGPPTGAGAEAKRVWLSNPHLTMDQIHGEVSKRLGTEAPKATVSTAYSDLRQTLCIMQEVGLISKEVLDQFMTTVHAPRAPKAAEAPVKQPEPAPAE